MCLPTAKHTPVRKVTSSRYSCFLLVLPQSSPNAFSTRKTDSGWGTHCCVTVWQPRHVNPMRTDIGRLQLYWMTAQDFDRRVLKCCNDFFYLSPMECKCNTLKICLYGPRRQPVLGQGQATQRLIRSRKGLIGWYLISLCQADEWTVWKTAPRRRRTAVISGRLSGKNRLKVKPHMFFILCYPWCSLQLGLVAKT